MKSIFVIVFVLTGFMSSAQESERTIINRKVRSIDLDETLNKIELKNSESSQISPDGGNVLYVWKNKKQIVKIVNETILSYGSVTVTMYLDEGLPIRIIETEKNFEQIKGDLNYSKLNEVFKISFTVFDWEKEDAITERKGRRVFTDAICSVLDFEPLIVKAKKAIN